MSHSFSFSRFRMNLSLTSDFPKLLVFFNNGEPFHTATCPFWGINLFLQALTSSKYDCDNLKTIWKPHGLKKSHFTKYLAISEREIRRFTFIHLNFELKNSNLRLRLYLIKYKMIKKLLWQLIQVNLPLKFYINEIPISLQ